MSKTEYVIDLEKVKTMQDVLILFPLLIRRNYTTFSEDKVEGMEHLFRAITPEIRLYQDVILRQLARNTAESLDRQLLQMIGGRR